MKGIKRAVVGNKLRHIAIVQSPLQLIGVRSFVIKRGLSKSDFRLVVRAPLRTGSGKALYKELCNDIDAWGDVVCLRSKRKFLPIVSLARECKKHKWETVVFGDVRAWWMKVLVANLTYDEKVLVDDGTSTIVDYENYMVSGVDYQKINKSKELLLKWLGLEAEEKQVWPLKLFTIFSLPDTPYVSVENGYVFDEEVFCQAAEMESPLAEFDTVCIFIGQPIVGDDKISRQSYVHGIEEALSRCGGAPVVYFAHRGEGAEVLDYLSNALGIMVLKNASPIEWVIYSNVEKISHVMSYCSTAMFTAKLISSALPVTCISLEGAESGSKDLVERSGIIQKYLLTQDRTSRIQPEY